MSETFEALKIDVPQCPVFMRPHSSDFSNYVQIFIQRHYGFLEDLKDVRLVIDCGAYVGFSAAWFLTKFPLCSVIAIEPDAQNFSLLQANLKPYERAIMFKRAVWPVSDISMQRVDNKYRDGQAWSLQFEPNVNGHVKSISLVEIARKFAVSGRIDILKIDIEGAEAILLASDYAEWLQRVENIVIELHDDSSFGDATQAFINACADQFTIQRFGEITFAQRRR